MRERLLRLERFGVAFGAHVVLANVHLEVESPGMHVVVGPAGAGKSTLLRTLAGLNASQPSLRVWGALRGRGDDGTLPQISIVQQDARLLASSVRENVITGMPDRAALTIAEQSERVRALLCSVGLGFLATRLADDVVSLKLGEQRLLAILRAAISRSELLLVDEPTVGLDEPWADAVVSLLRRLARETAVMVVTHHQGHARALGGTTFLLAGGRIIESARTNDFFDCPATASGRTFVETGGCPDPGPGARADELADDVLRPTPVPPAFQRAATASLGPVGFYWLEPGRIGGVPRPGIVDELDHDLAGLMRLGVTVLITLEERATVSPERLAAYGIRAVHVPIPDMHAPSIEVASALCARIDTMLAAGDVVAVHCLAGLGRTGTLLAAYLVSQGASPVDALERVRAIRARSIQSQEQAEFLVRFAAARAHRSESSSVHEDCEETTWRGGVSSWWR